MRKANRHTRLMLVALVCSVVAAVVSWFLAPPMFCLNDDSKMQLILSGGSTGSPSGHAVFINIVLGELIAGLFRVVPSIPWWFVWQEACVLASVYLWCLSWGYAFCGNNEPLSVRRVALVGLMATLSSVGAFLYAFSLTSFTLTAGTLAASAVLLQCMRGRAEELRRRRRYGVYLVLMIVAAYCTRPSAAKATLPFAVLLFVPGVVAALRNDDRKAHLLVLAHSAAPFALGVLLALACNVANNVAYGTPEWQQFLATNAARHKYMDAPHDSFEENPELYRSQGWSQELETLVNDEWLFMDDRVTPESFVALSREGAKREQLGVRHIVDSWRYGEGMFDSRTVTGLLVLFLLCAVLVLALCSDAQTWLMILAGLVACGAEIYFLEMQGRLVTRVALVALWPAVAFVLGMLITCGRDAAEERSAKEADARPHAALNAVRVVAAVLLVLLAARFALAAWRTDALWKLAYSLLWLEFAALLVLWGRSNRAWLRGVVVGALLPVLVACCPLTSRDVRGTLVTLHEYERAADLGISYVEGHPNDQYFTAVSLFSSYDPWRTTLPGNMMYVGGWEYYVPTNLARMDKLRGDDAHNYDVMLRDGVKVLLLTDEQADLLCSCIEQVTGKDVNWMRAGNPGYGVLVQYREVA